MEVLERVVGFLNNLVWNTPETLPAMVILLLGYGIFITLRMGFIQIRRFTHGIKVVSGFYDNPDDTGDVNHFQALSTALSATVGIGNIAGVAIAIHYGGPGALFWMWVTAFFGMAIKYSECTLAVKYRIQNADGSVSGGPMYYIERGLGENWKWLAVIFASLAVICSFFTGNAIQANTVADVMENSFFIIVPPYVTGLITASLVGIVIIGGIKRIGYVTARLTPLMAIVYVLGALLILLINYDQVLPSFGKIFSYAFNPQAGAWGVGSGLFITTMVWGVKRGLFSNEAGQGSAPIAHGAAKTEEPVREGVVALLEPFIDTIMVCTMTGLVIISTGVWDTKHMTEVNLGSPDLDFEISQSLDQPNTLVVEDGIIQNGSMLRSDFAIDTVFANIEQTELFSGTIDTDSYTATYEPSGEVSSIVYGKEIYNGATLTSQGFEDGLAPLFPGGKYIVTISVLLFAISTSISWSYYGDRSIQYLLGDKSIIYYKAVYVVLHFVGAITALGTIWAIGDIALGLMTFPNLIALFALSGVVYGTTKDYFKRMEESEDND
ncbi:alanine/glycine:cation symporter family protein [Rhodohalobacter sulfatireducens]|uniref:Sodium:alanine symporter family protein n=1 Tax=Rhodohalobacter sulfatireducens TaxID=2911366 RepID=A0ABS9KDT8_9BACT|nr:sodium:alanine symporter family protein [Rhodohalobacter sulfatireducens]MCG2588995.1 sodium:alanine symporter family protein [Rhodohalobacter sulfatireducens]